MACIIIHSYCVGRKCDEKDMSRVQGGAQRRNIQVSLMDHKRLLRGNNIWWMVVILRLRMGLPDQNNNNNKTKTEKTWVPPSEKGGHKGRAMNQHVQNQSSLSMTREMGQRKLEIHKSPIIKYLVCKAEFILYFQTSGSYRRVVKQAML